MNYDVCISIYTDTSTTTTYQYHQDRQVNTNICKTKMRKKISAEQNKSIKLATDVNDQKHIMKLSKQFLSEMGSLLDKYNILKPRTSMRVRYKDNQYYIIKTSQSYLVEHNRPKDDPKYLIVKSGESDTEMETDSEKTEGSDDETIVLPSSSDTGTPKAPSASMKKVTKKRLLSAQK